MRELWLVARQEYRNHVRQRSFLLGMIAIPLMLVVSVVGVILVSQSGQDPRPVGYVDQAGVLAAGVIPQEEDGQETIAVRALADPAAGRAALQAGEIQAYYVLPANYLQTRQVELYYLEQEPASSVQRRFAQFVRANLLAGEPLGTRSWALAGPNLIIRSPDGSREWSESNMINVILPFVFGFLFFFVVMGTSGYMLQVVTDEKENRTIEVMITSITPGQLIGGKALGLIGVALTQIAIWALAAAVALLVGAQFSPFFRGVQVSGAFLLITLLFFLPSYVLISGMMTTVGAAVTELRQGQQIAGILNMLFVLPLLLSAIIFINPNSPLLVILTLFPTTSMLTVMMRWGVAVIPLWQLVAGWLLAMGAAGLSIWAAARVFRLGMLRYGQELKLREALAGLRRKQS